MSLFVAGFNGYGELGLGHHEQVDRFQRVIVTDYCRGVAQSPALGVVSVAASPNKTYCLLSDGTVFESGVTTNLFSRVHRLDGKSVISISATAMELVAVSRSMIYVIPAMESATLSPRAFSLPSPAVNRGFVSVSCGSLFSIALCASGTVYSFGLNTYGQLGCGNADTNAQLEDSLQSVIFSDLRCGERVVYVSCGGCHALAVTNSGSVFIWGNNKHGQLGLGQDNLCESVIEPVRVDPSTFNHERIISGGCGDYHTLLISDDGSLFGAGRNQDHQLCSSLSTEDVCVFTKLDVFDAAAVDASRIVPRRVVGGGGHGCSHSAVVDTSGKVWLWGSNAKGQLGQAPEHNATSVVTFVVHDAVPAEEEVHITLGWRTSIVYAARSPSLLLTGGTNMNALGLDQALTPDVLDRVVQYLTTSDSRVLLLVSRRMSEIVRHCWPLWKKEVTSLCPFTLAQLENSRRRKEQQQQQQSQDAIGVDDNDATDWFAVVSEHRRSRFNQVTPFPAGTDDSPTTSGLGGFVRAAKKITCSSLCSVFRLFDKQPPEALRQSHRILMIGLDAAGKTTILYHLKLGEVVTSIPTIGFNVETVSYQGTDFTCWDVGGPDKIRPLWRHYYQGTTGVIFCVDSNDRWRVEEMVREVQRVRDEESLVGVPMLIFANKQDLPNAMRVDHIAAEINKPTPLVGMWCVQGSCATKGQGLYEGLAWLDWAVRLPTSTPGAAA